MLGCMLNRADLFSLFMVATVSAKLLMNSRVSLAIGAKFGS